MSMGGIQKALVEQLNAIKDKYDITLYCIKAGGECIDFLPQGINIIYGNKYALISEQSLNEAKKSGLFIYALKIIFTFFTKAFGKKIPAFLLTKLMGKISGEYDVAISYAQPIHDKHFSNINNEIVLNCCNAKSKVTFIHCDFIKYGGNTKYNRSLYKRFDKIAVVSNSVGRRFLEAVPELENRVFTVYNSLDNENIISLANENPSTYNKKTVITVARLSEEKGLVRCVPIFAKLCQENFDVQWHIVGDGPLKAELQQTINAHNMQENIILHGQQTNPYRFMKNANFFLLPSFHEAAPVVYFESAALNLPVLTTNTMSAVELVEKRLCGTVCDNTDEAIFYMLKTALEAEDIKYMCQPTDNALALSQFENIVKE